jgi:hypothetical protein
MVMNGPGGFPLVGAVATGHRNSRTASTGGDMETTPPNEPVEPQLETVTLDADGGTFEAGATGDELRELGLSAQLWSGFPLSVFSGFGLATVLTLNAVLSQPIAGYDYLRSRLETRVVTSYRPRRANNRKST